MSQAGARKRESGPGEVGGGLGWHSFVHKKEVKEGRGELSKKEDEEKDHRRKAGLQKEKKSPRPQLEGEGKRPYNNLLRGISLGTSRGQK